jgi:hypothetical protein
MKKVFVFFAIAVMTFAKGFAQKIKDADVPSAVKASFAKAYPGATAKWEMEKGNFEASFKKDGKSMSAVFQPGGAMLESETAIKESELPASALSYIQTNYKGKKIKETAKITSSNGTVTYEAEVEGKDLIFSSDGKFLKEVKD